MQETIRSRREQEARGGLGNIFGGADTPAPMVTVMSGPYAEQLPVGNMTVGEIRRRFRDRFDIAPNSQATLDGHEVGDDTVVRAGQVLSFIRHAGEKGTGRMEGRKGGRVEGGSLRSSNLPVFQSSLAR